MEYKWPLSIPQFSLFDKIKFVTRILTNDRWTHGDDVTAFEEAMAKFVQTKYAIFTSSGSTANTLLAMYLKDTELNKKNIIFPSTTWITSVSPFIREGFKPVFIDINMEDFSISLEKLEEYLKVNAKSTACVFITSLIGFTPNIDRLITIGQKYNVRIMMDNCENTLGKFGSFNVSSFFTSTTSTYFGHQLQSIEGGFIFTNNEIERDYFVMARNHGMLRHLPPDRQTLHRNPMVDAAFDFGLLGNNFRNTNLNAFLGLCDLQRAEQYFHSRKRLYNVFTNYLDDFLILPEDTYPSIHAPFCLPIIPKSRYKNKLVQLKKLCGQMSIETRPIISGNLLRQTPFSNTNYIDFTNSEYLHNNGFYIGLHGSTKQEDVEIFSKRAITIIQNE